jgi:hypothetical protein
MELELVWRDRRVDGAPGRTPRRFLDFHADGQSLYEAIDEDLISCLGWFTIEEDEHAAQRLLLAEQPDVDGRFAIYVCPECGDIYCGTLTVIIERQGGEFVWRDRELWSTFDFLEGHHEPEPKDLPELRFDADQYRATIMQRPRPQP